MLISSHRLDEVASLVNRVIELDQGRVVLDDRVTEEEGHRIIADLREKLDLAVEFTYKCQNENGGWRYAPLAPDSDMSITVCQVVALREAGVPTVFQSGYESYVPKTRVVLFEAAMAIPYGLDRDADSDSDVDDPFGDDDGDGWRNGEDNCPQGPNPTQGTVGCPLPIAKPYQKCLNEMNKRGALLLKTQGRLNLACVKIEGEEHLIMREDDILGVIE